MTRDKALDLSRTIVVGTSCSGKTTFAQQLARRLGVDHVELDELNWLPGWVERDASEFRSLVADRARGEKWVVDGNYSVSAVPQSPIMVVA